MDNTTITEWIGLPVYRPADRLRLVHLWISVVLHFGCVGLAAFNCVLFCLYPDLRKGVTRWHSWIVFSICVVDFFLNIFQLGAVIDQLAAGGWRLSDTWCQFQGFTSALFGFMSFNGVTMLTNERTYTILLRKTWTGTHTLIGVLLSYGSALILAALYFSGGNRYALQESGIYCSPDYGAILRPQPHPTVNRVVSYFLGVIAFVTYTNMICTYLAIWITVRKTARKLERVIKINAPRDKNVAKSDGVAPISQDQNALATLSSKSNVPIDKEEEEDSRRYEIRAGGGASGQPQSGSQKESSGNDSSDAGNKFMSKKRMTLETAIAMKSAIMIGCYVLTFIATSTKIIYSGARAEPISREWDMIAALLAVSPGIVNPLCNDIMDVRWRRASLSMLAAIRRIPGRLLGTQEQLAETKEPIPTSTNVSSRYLVPAGASPN
ncbi:uncharacterized protein SPPG_02538 [Spizellomyces punctatus DAOM BR117]|uniref:G-protein coupled receptors family 1 profile domain-containing protein n=1 Tax=Spizellomyces punctatus (strain DAOM BR117) TaxID=645134 RepID=A0A0L0HM93_SPIPD|nr:uncharacterized protein SPPG_02538 [Spizellomyces punctatus DAOM BR117]KND02035.1 hypothetical protein SPPG_02538 [Spizellomyces punctatus DAOM BR117]|eukprot:XP_016610074.1 hypothetical protein SPPG_02538 [Spizellomyces punctatus DAOM BR117]